MFKQPRKPVRPPPRPVADVDRPLPPLVAPRQKELKNLDFRVRQVPEKIADLEPDRRDAQNVARHEPRAAPRPSPHPYTIGRVMARLLLRLFFIVVPVSPSVPKVVPCAAAVLGDKKA